MKIISNSTWASYYIKNISKRMCSRKLFTNVNDKNEQFKHDWVKMKSPQVYIWWTCNKYCIFDCKLTHVSTVPHMRTVHYSLCWPFLPIFMTARCNFRSKYSALPLAELTRGSCMPSTAFPISLMLRDVSWTCSLFREHPNTRNVPEILQFEA